MKQLPVVPSSRLFFQRLLRGPPVSGYVFTRHTCSTNGNMSIQIAIHMHNTCVALGDAQNYRPNLIRTSSSRAHQHHVRLHRRFAAAYHGNEGPTSTSTWYWLKKSPAPSAGGQTHGKHEYLLFVADVRVARATGPRCTPALHYQIRPKIACACQPTTTIDVPNPCVVGLSVVRSSAISAAV